MTEQNKQSTEKTGKNRLSQAEWEQIAEKSNERIERLEMLAAYYRDFMFKYLNVHGLNAKLSREANMTLKTVFSDGLKEKFVTNMPQRARVF